MNNTRDEVPPFSATTGCRLESVRMGRDSDLLDDMLDFYAPTAKRIVDVCCNRRKMWKGTRWGNKVTGYDINQEVMPDVVTGWNALPGEPPRPERGRGFLLHRAELTPASAGAVAPLSISVNSGRSIPS